MDDLAARLDRVESTLAIQQLLIRYALAVDGRDFDAWTELFVEDVNCGRHGVGRAVLKQFIEAACARFYISVHYACGHAISFQGPDQATGQVYCRAEHGRRRLGGGRRLGRGLSRAAPGSPRVEADVEMVRRAQQVAPDLRRRHAWIEPQIG